jgi:hypothetical protein
MFIRALLTSLALLMFTLPATVALADIPPAPDSTPAKKDSGGTPPTSDDDGGCAVAGKQAGAASALVLAVLGSGLALRRSRRQRRRD